MMLSLNKKKTTKTCITAHVEIESIEHLTVSDKLFCTTCNMALGDRDEQLEHYKCDLHLFNLKQKLKGRPAVGADEFEQLVGSLESSFQFVSFVFVVDVVAFMCKNNFNFK